MKRCMCALIALLVLSGLILPSNALAADDTVAAEVRKDVERTLDLWREGRYEDVYRRTVESGGHTKEYFISYLSAAPRRPACCWEKIQEVRVTVKDDRRALLKAKFGFDTGTGVEFMTKGLKLEKDDGIWKISLSEALALAGKGKRLSGGKRKTN